MMKHFLHSQSISNLARHEKPKSSPFVDDRLRRDVATAPVQCQFTRSNSISERECRPMAKRIVLVTGSLAEPRVKRIAEELDDAELEPIVANIGVKVAALMTDRYRRASPEAPGGRRSRHHAGPLSRRP